MEKLRKALPDLWGEELYQKAAEVEALFTGLRDEIEARIVALKRQKRTTAQRQVTLTAHDIKSARQGAEWCLPWLQGYMLSIAAAGLRGVNRGCRGLRRPVGLNVARVPLQIGRVAPEGAG